MKTEMLNYLRTIYTPGLMDDEEFFVSSEIALYWLANNYHNGQASELYSVLCQSKYIPGCLCGGIEDEGDEIAIDMYDDLRAVYNL